MVAAHTFVSRILPCLRERSVIHDARERIVPAGRWEVATSIAGVQASRKSAERCKRRRAAFTAAFLGSVPLCNNEDAPRFAVLTPVEHDRVVRDARCDLILASRVAWDFANKVKQCIAGSIGSGAA